jgi:hypothetical protein
VDPPPVHDCLVVNHRITPVNYNLYIGLCYLHYAGRVNSSTWLWVDALCINQNDVAEKSQQVGALHKFFPTASQVLVWLGESDLSHQEETELATFLRNFRPALRRAEAVLGDQFTRLANNELIFERDAILNSVVLDAIGLDYFPSLLLKILRICREQRWFHRLWPSQEFATARELTMRLGTAEFDPGHLIGVDRYLSLSGWDMALARAFQRPELYRSYHSTGIDRMRNLKMDLQLSLGLRESATWQLWHLQTDAIDEERPQPAGEEDQLQIRATILAWMLYKQAAGACQDMRDKVYGNQGLIEVVLGSFTSLGNPDYSANVDIVYVHTSSELLRLSKNLDLITYQHFLTSSQERGVLPTWVTDYRELRDEPCMHDFIKWGNGIRSRSVFSRNSACVLEPLGRQLVCCGIFLSTTSLIIQPVLTKVSDPDEFAADVLGPLELIQNIASYKDIRRPAEMRPVEILWRTLCLNMDIATTAVPEKTWEESFWHWVVLCLRRLRDSQT